MCNNCKVESQMEKLREKMISAALLLGMDHPLVLEYSQKLDEKHNYILAYQAK